MSNHALNHFQASEPVSLFAKHLTRFKNTSKMTPMVYTGSYQKLLWSSKMSNLVTNTCPKKQDQSGWHNKIRLCVFQKNNHVKDLRSEYTSLSDVLPNNEWTNVESHLSLSLELRWVLFPLHPAIYPHVKVWCKTTQLHVSNYGNLQQLWLKFNIT